MILIQIKLTPKQMMQNIFISICEKKKKLCKVLSTVSAILM